MSEATAFERGSHITLQTVMAYLDAIGGSHFAVAISLASADGTLERFRPDAIGRSDVAAVAILDPVSPTASGRRR